MKCIAAIVGLAIATNALGQQARVLTVPSHPQYGQLVPLAISGDGRVVVGRSTYGPHGPVPMSWTIDGTFDVMLDPGPNGNGAKATVCSYDGSIIGGTFAYTGSDVASQIAFRWVRGGAMTLLTGNPGQPKLFSASAMNGDGSMIGGDVIYSEDRAAVWTQEAGVTTIPGIPNGSHSRIIGRISADGQAMTGLLTAGGTPFVWRADSGSFIVPLPNQLVHANGVSITANGDAIFGTAGAAAPGSSLPFTWNPDTGSTALPGVDPMANLAINAASADGRVALGYANSSGSLRFGSSGAVVYTLGSGVRYLADVVGDYGIHVSRSTFGVSIDVSDDGRTFLVGNTAPYYVVILPQPALADFNLDREIDFIDYQDFVDCFTGNSILPISSADINHDGTVDLFDYDEFVRRLE